MEQLRRTLEILRPWYDPSSYRSLVSVVIVSFAVFLWPLVCDFAGAIHAGTPSHVRWCFGEAVIVAILACGLRRLIRVLPTDTWPSTSSSAHPDNERALSRRVPWRFGWR